VRLFLVLSSGNHLLGSRSYSINLRATWTHSRIHQLVLKLFMLSE